MSWLLWWLLCWLTGDDLLLVLLCGILWLRCLTEKSLLSSHLGRWLVLDMLLSCLQLRMVLVQHLQAGAGQTRSTDAGVHHRDHVRWDATIQRFAKHRLLNLSLLEPQLLLPRSLFFLLPLVLLCSS